MIEDNDIRISICRISAFSDYNYPSSSWENETKKSPWLNPSHLAKLRAKNPDISLRQVTKIRQNHNTWPSYISYLEELSKDVTAIKIHTEMVDGCATYNEKIEYERCETLEYQREIPLFIWDRQLTRIATHINIKAANLTAEIWQKIMSLYPVSVETLFDKDKASLLVPKSPQFIEQSIREIILPGMHRQTIW